MVSLWWQTLFVGLMTVGVVRSAEEVQINTQLPIAVLSERFLSISIDPKELFDNVPLPDASKTMARALAPMFVQLAGPSTKYLTEPVAAANLSEKNWRALSSWTESVGAAVIAALPAGRHVSGVWDSAPALAALANAHAARAPLLFQLGYDAAELGEGGEAGRDLARLRQIVDSFPGYRGAPLLPPGLRPRDSNFVRRLLVAAPNAMPVLPVHLNMTGMDIDAAADEMSAASATLEDVITDSEPLSLSSSHRPLWIGDTGRDGSRWKDAIAWLCRLGTAARQGARVYLHRISPSTLTRPTPEFWVAALYRAIVGTRVLETRLEPARPGLKLFAQCSRHNPPPHSLLDPTWRYEKGALTIFGVNTGPRSTVLNLRAISVRDEPVHLFILTNPDGKETLFNGERLGLSPEGRLPMVSPEVRSSAKGLTIPPGAVFFAVFPEARPLACAPGTPLAAAALAGPVRNLARSLLPPRSSHSSHPSSAPRYVNYERRSHHSDVSPLETLDLSSRVMREFSRTVSRLALLASPRDAAARARRHTARASEGYKRFHDYLTHIADPRDDQPVEPLEDFLKDMADIKVAVHDGNVRRKRGADQNIVFSSMPQFDLSKNNKYASQSEPKYPTDAMYSEESETSTGDSQADVDSPYYQPNSEYPDKTYSDEESQGISPYSSISEPPYHSQEESPYTQEEIQSAAELPEDIQLEDYSTDSKEGNRRATRAPAEDMNGLRATPEEQEAIRHFVNRAHNVLENRHYSAKLPSELPIQMEDEVAPQPVNNNKNNYKANKWGSTGIQYLDDLIASNYAAGFGEIPSLDDLMAQQLDLATLDQLTGLPSIDLPTEVMSLDELMAKNAEALTALESLLSAQQASFGLNSPHMSNSGNKRAAQHNGIDFGWLQWPQQMADEKRLRIEEMGKQLSGIQEQLHTSLKNMGPNLDSQPLAPKDLADKMAEFVSSFHTLTGHPSRSRRSTDETLDVEEPKSSGQVKSRVRRQISYRDDDLDGWDDYSGELVSQFPRDDNLNAAGPPGPYYDLEAAKLEGLVNQVLELVTGRRRFVLDDVLVRKRRSLDDNIIPTSQPKPVHDPTREHVAKVKSGSDLRSLAEEYTRLKGDSTASSKSMKKSDKEEEDDWMAGAERISPRVAKGRKKTNSNKNRNDRSGLLSALLERLASILALIKSITKSAPLPA